MVQLSLMHGTMNYKNLLLNINQEKTHICHECVKGTLRQKTKREIMMRKYIDTQIAGLKLRFAEPEDTKLILSLIKELAEYEKLLPEVVADEAVLRESLFERRAAEVIIGEYEGNPVSYSLFFHNFSTFLGRPGIFIEDLYVKPAMRGRGIGKVMLSFLAKLTKERNCGRLEWSCLDWNVSSIRFYKQKGATPMEEWTVYRVTEKSLADLADSFKAKWQEESSLPNGWRLIGQA